jgi:tetratricopeptide (TPR) repeat protein
MEGPIFGRDVVLRRMGSSLRRGRSQAIFGDEGVGKTRLAAELSRSAAAGGDVVQRVVGSSTSVRVPFGALSHLLSMPAASRDELGLMASLMGELRARATAGRRLMLVADDAHLLDEHSAAFLHQVAAHRVATLLLTVRLGEPLPSAITQVWKNGLAERVEVGPLTRPATTALARSIVGGEIEDLTMSELWRRTRGNPLYLRELILAGLETGALASDGVTWRPNGPLPPSHRLAEVVHDRLGRLTRQQQYAVELLAVADSLELDLLTSLAGVRAVEALEERRVILVNRDAQPPVARAAHPIYTEVVNANVPLGRQQRIKGELANTLAERGASAPDELLRLALWRLDAGSSAEPDLLLAAAARALGVFDAPLGERLARAALDGGGAKRLEAALLLGRALAAQQRVADAEDVLRAATANARGDDEIAGVALALANLLYFRAGRAEAATRVLLEALDRVRDRDWRTSPRSMAWVTRSWPQASSAWYVAPTDATLFRRASIPGRTAPNPYLPGSPCASARNGSPSSWTHRRSGSACTSMANW